VIVYQAPPVTGKAKNGWRTQALGIAREFNPQARGLKSRDPQPMQCALQKRPDPVEKMSPPRNALRRTAWDATFRA